MNIHQLEPEWKKLTNNNNNNNNNNNRCSEIVQREYNRLDWLGKITPWELCKKFKFDYANRWYMHNQESVLENKMHKFSGILINKQIM